MFSGVDSGGAGGARAPLVFGDSEKGRSLISAYWSLAVTASTSGCSTMFIFVRELSITYSIIAIIQKIGYVRTCFASYV